MPVVPEAFAALTVQAVPVPVAYQGRVAVSSSAACPVHPVVVASRGPVIAAADPGHSVEVHPVAGNSQ